MSISLRDLIVCAGVAASSPACVRTMGLGSLSSIRKSLRPASLRASTGS
mgnify:CR=1 FL=1